MKWTNSAQNTKTRIRTDRTCAEYIQSKSIFAPTIKSISHSRKQGKGRGKTKKDIIAVFALILLVALVIKGTNIQSVDEYYLTHIDDIRPDSETVTISIRCDTVLSNLDDLDPALKQGDYIPSDGVILPPTEYVLRPGDTVFDILDRAVRYNKIQMEYQGSDENSYGSVYIRGINYLYEFSCGPLSGWMYRVDGEYPNFGCSKYELKDGQNIEWIYTCDLGEDVGCEWVGEETAK